MSIFQPSKSVIKWALNTASLSTHEIGNILSTIPIDKTFPQRLCALVQTIKDGKSSYGEFHYDTSCTILESLMKNDGLTCLGTGSYSACFKTADNKVFKINIMNKFVDAGIAFAISCHKTKKPFLPNVANVCHYQSTYCIETELLEEVGSLSYSSGINVMMFQETIEQNNLNEFVSNVKDFMFTQFPESKTKICIRHCKQLFSIIERVKDIQKIKDISPDFIKKTVRLDISSDNIMIRGNQIVFNDPVF